MTESSLWQCRAVANLPQELVLYDGRSTSEPTVMPPAFPGVIVTLKECLAGFTGFGEESRGTLSITNPVFLIPQPEEVRSALFRMMLQTVCDQAARLQCRTLRCVQPHQLPDDLHWLTNTLSESLFRIQATVIRWCLQLPEELSGSRSDHRDQRVSDLIAASSSEPIRFQFLSTRVFSNDETLRKQTAEGLKLILADSADLPNLPVPDPEDMFREWLDDDAELLIATEGQTFIGLLALVAEPSSGNQQICSFRIQYIGIRPDRRRKGIASHMLQLVFQELVRRADSELASEVRVSVYADRENHAASSLYQRSRFIAAELNNIWCREIP